MKEQEEKIRDAERDRTNREKLTLKYTLWTLVAAVMVGIAAIVLPLLRWQ